MNFTAHNIRLPDGTETWPEGPILEELGTFRGPVRMLNLVFPDGLLGKSIADLGCLEGGYTVGFARLGMDATGIEIRDSNLENCRYVQSKLNLANLHFIKDDVNNIDRYGTFDVIFVPGVFYHLDRPRAFLEKASNVCRKVIFLETHFTYKHWTAGAELYRLSELCENEGLMGRWFTEHDFSPGPKLDALKWASWENKRSFWIQREYLLDLLAKVGFSIVLEQYDIFAGDILGGIEAHYNALDRGMFVGIRNS
jgi:SAM-dependent methyltransferase